MELTVAGKVFYAGVKKMLSVRHQMLQKVAQVSTKRRSKITVAIATFDSPPFLPALLAEYASQYPQYEIAVVKRLAADISHNMSGVDLYFSWLPLDPNLEHVMLLENDQFAVVVHNHLLANVYGGKWPKLEQELLATENLALLKQLPFIMLYDKNGFLSRDLDIIFQSYGFSPRWGSNRKTAI